MPERLAIARVSSGQQRRKKRTHRFGGDLGRSVRLPPTGDAVAGFDLDQHGSALRVRPLREAEGPDELGAPDVRSDAGDLHQLLLVSAFVKLPRWGQSCRIRVRSPR